jgi:hypothetical protein
VPGDAAPWLAERALDREACIGRIIELRHAPHQLLAGQPLGVDAGEPHDVAAAVQRIDLGVVMRGADRAALAEHDVEVELAGQPLPELEGVLVELRVRANRIVRAHDGSVAPGVAAADVAALEHGDVAEPVVLREVVRGRETVPAATDDHDLVRGFQRGRAPGPRPAPVAAQRMAREAEDRVARYHMGKRR